MPLGFEPYKIKAVESIPLTTRAQREKYLRQAHYNLFSLKARNVTIDLLTDSGTGAMSQMQWSAMMRGDESYAGAQSFFNFERSVREITGMHHVIPTHQGRAAENLLFSALVEPGQLVPNNTHFDTTEANVRHKGGVALNLPCREAHDPDSRAPFKGNMDWRGLDRLLREQGRERVPLVMVTVTNNSVGGQPVSLANLRRVREVCDRHGVPLYLDAARYAENCWFIKHRERGQAKRPLLEIARELFGLAHGATMSAKKDGLVNIGGFLATRSKQVARKVTEVMVVIEGFRTYGGLAGRDLEALAVGLREGLEESWLDCRIGQVERLAKKLDDAGVPVQLPAGGHAVFIDAARFAPHVPPLQFPGQSLSCALYLEGGVRTSEIGSVMFASRDEQSGEELPAPMELVRLAVPRRVYTDNHLDYVAQVVIAVHKRRAELRGLRLSYAPQKLRHFLAHFKPI
ncbi:MAG: tryptophanase [Candidatus Alcyoniella australis]|nr:tryptophanase [Candidatus Alcyoniella australis]